jgi:hypothetical protein
VEDVEDLVAEEVEVDVDVEVGGGVDVVVVEDVAYRRMISIRIWKTTSNQEHFFHLPYTVQDERCRVCQNIFGQGP